MHFPIAAALATFLFTPEPPTPAAQNPKVIAKQSPDTILPQSADAILKPTFTFDQLWHLENTFWKAFMYPANLKEAQGNGSSVFTSDVSPSLDAMSR